MYIYVFKNVGRTIKSIGVARNIQDHRLMIGVQYYVSDPLINFIDTN